MSSNSIYCSIITIGDELLIGQTIDTNSAWIAQTLNPIGVEVKRRVAVGDNKSDIILALKQELEQSQILIITGGLGPTADDITKPLLCDFFGGRMIENTTVLKHVTDYFSKRNRPILESNLRQAMVPDVCEVLFNAVGTAPGMMFKEAGRLIFSLPGVPFEMKHIMTNHVVDKIKSQFQTQNFIHQTLVTAGEGESFVANRLIEFEQQLPLEIKLAYLPKLGVLKLRLTGRNIEFEKLNFHFQKLRFLLENIEVADEDIELEKKIGLILSQNSETISFAESCTGGNIASMITSISGASSYFKGALVVYQNEIKRDLLGVNALTLETQTAVSEQTAMEMALCCRQKFKTNYALSVTGYLEQGEQNNEVWIGMASASQCIAVKINPPYDRQKNTVLTSNTALNLLRKFILSH